MLFNSFSFAIFFPIVTVLYFAPPHRWNNPFQLVASGIFYCAAIPTFLLILWFTIIVDYKRVDAGPAWVRWTLYYVGILGILLFGEFEARPFFCFQF